MKSNKKSGFFAIPLLAGALGLASGVHADDLEVGKPKVTAWGYSVLVANFTGATATGTLRCGAGTAAQGLIPLDVSAPQGQAMYSMLLAAVTAGRSITLQYTLNSGNNCILNAVTMTPE